MALCNLCNRNISLTKENVFRIHTTSKDSKVLCDNAGKPAPDWFVQWKAKQVLLGDNYREYLQSEHWKELSAETKRLAGERCQVCNSESKLHVHHRTYERKGRELQSDVIALCENCHELFHSNQNFDPRKTCRWTLESDGLLEMDIWEAGCGGSWEFETGDPKENGMNFCPFCGFELEQVPASTSDIFDEED